MRRLFALTIAIFIFSAIAYAQVPTAGNIFLGYSHVNSETVDANRSALNGWNGSLEGKVFPFVGIVADIGGYYGKQNFPVPVIPVGVCVPGAPCTTTNPTSRVLTATFGPRVSFSVGKFRPFAHVLVGAARTTGSVDGSDTSFADAIGGGLDYHLLPLIGWRLQLDELQTRFFSTTQNNFRLSTGIVIHF